MNEEYSIIQFKYFIKLYIRKELIKAINNLNKHLALVIRIDHSGLLKFGSCSGVGIRRSIKLAPAVLMPAIKVKRFSQSKKTIKA